MQIFICMALGPELCYPVLLMIKVDAKGSVRWPYVLNIALRRSKEYQSH